MWAGGSFHFPTTRGAPLDDKTAGLRIGSTVSEETSVLKVEQKSGMVFVHQLKEYKVLGSEAPLLKEVRIHVFRPALDAAAAGKESAKATSTSDRS